jgi:hypothetical protein
VVEGILTVIEFPDQLPSLLGNPGFVILVGPLFFGVRAFPIFTLAAIGSLVAIVYLEVLGYGAEILSTARNRGQRLPEIIVGDHIISSFQLNL